MTRADISIPDETIPTGINAGKTIRAVFMGFIERCRGEGCWNWPGRKYRNGYGRFNAMGRGILAHRASFYFFNERAPSKMVLHKCDNPACVNPNHLFEGDARDNMMDCISKGRNNHARGERCAKSKLSDSAVIEICRRVKEGEMQRVVAADFSISQKQVSVITRGLQWAHIHNSQETEKP